MPIKPEGNKVNEREAAEATQLRTGSIPLLLWRFFGADGVMFDAQNLVDLIGEFALGFGMTFDERLT